MEKNTIFILNNKKLMSEWDWEKNNKLGLFPDELSHKSNKSVYWKCSKGRSWTDTIYHRTDGRGCPYCSNRRVLVGYNDLSTLFPELLKEWDYETNIDIKPEQFVVGSATLVNWACSQCGNKWSASIRNRTQRKQGCPVCSAKIRAKERHVTILQKKGGITDPLLLKEWNYEKNGDLRPEQFTEGSGEKVWWKCSKCKHEWKAKILNRTKNKRDCPACANQVVVKGLNDLASTHPHLAAEWHPTMNGDLTPDKVTYGNGQKVWWMCPFGHEYLATVNKRSSGTNCPKCNSGRQTSFAEQAFYYYIKKIYPDALNRYKGIFNNRMEIDIFIPSRRIAIEYDGVYWHNKEKNEREKRKYQICQKNNIRLIRIREDANSDCGDIADEIYQTENLDDRKKLQTTIMFVLQHLEKFKTTYYFRYPDVDLERDENEIRQLYLTQLTKNSLEKTHPKLVDEWNYEKNGSLLPSMFHAGSGARVYWKCSVCGHEWKTSILSRTSGAGCEKCFRKQNRGATHAESKCVYQYTLEGEFIKKWDCVSVAGRELRINASSIGACARHQHKTAGGFRWEYEYVDKLSTIKNK